MKRVLVTGSHGFVGRHFVKRFLDEGHFVDCVDNICAGLFHHQWQFKPKSFKQFTHFDVDVRHWFDKHPPDVYDLIIHCAAIVGGRLKIDGDPLAVATDLSIDSEFFNWVVRADKKPTVVYFSSSAVYPLSNQTKTYHCQLYEGLQNFFGKTIGMPDMSYGFVKLAGEYLCKFAVENYGADVRIYRPFGGYGEDQSFDYPFPSIIRRIVNGENPVTVWGSGDQERDFIHIDDIVSAVLTTIPKMKSGDVLNLGTGRALSFKQLAKIAAEQIGVKCTIVNDATKPEGVFSRVAGIQKLSQYWHPTISVEEGILRVFKVLVEQGLTGSK